MSCDSINGVHQGLMKLFWPYGWCRQSVITRQRSTSRWPGRRPFLPLLGRILHFLRHGLDRHQRLPARLEGAVLFHHLYQSHLGFSTHGKAVLLVSRASFLFLLPFVLFTDEARIVNGQHLRFSMTVPVASMVVRMVVVVRRMAM